MKTVKLPKDGIPQMRFYFDQKLSNFLQQLSNQIANARFSYGCENLGVQDKLVQTRLLDSFYLRMTLALKH
jgi:hypothetical protein